MQLSHTRPIDEVLAAGRMPSWPGEPVSTCARRWPSSASRPSRLGGAARGAGRRSTTAWARRRPTRLLAERDPAAASAVHANDRRRVVRALELAEAGHVAPPRDVTASGQGTTRHVHDRRRSASTSRASCSAADPARTPADVRAGRRGRGRAGLRAQPLSRGARGIIGLQRARRRSPARRPSRRSRRARGAMPPTSESGCGGSPALLPLTPTAHRRSRR